MKVGDLKADKKFWGGSDGVGRFITKIRSGVVHFVIDDAEPETVRRCSIADFLAWTKMWEDRGHDPRAVPRLRPDGRVPLDRRQLSAGEREDD